MRDKLKSNLGSAQSLGRVLLIDDDSVIRSIVDRALSEIVEIKSVASGVEALELCKTWIPDIILLDLTLPDYQEFNLLKILRSDPKLLALPIFIITGQDEDKFHIGAIKAGASRFFKKPINLSLLREIVALELGNLQRTNLPLPTLNDDKYDSMIGVLSDAVIVSNEEGTILSANEHCLKLFGYTANELIGSNVSVLAPRDIQVHHDRYMRDYRETGYRNLIGKPRQLPAITKSGEQLIVELNISEYYVDTTRNFISVVRNITERVEKERNSKFIDSLTGVSSLSGFNNDLQIIMESFDNNIPSYTIVSLIDIDGFHGLNVVFGRTYGDQLLLRLGSDLTSLKDKYNMGVYRIYGDRFMLMRHLEINSNEEFDEVRFLAELNSLISNFVDSSSASISVTGVSINYTDKEIERGEVIQYMESALDRLKRKGTSGKVVKADYEYFDDEFLVSSLAIDLARGLDRSKVSVVFQPKVNEAHEITSFEALLRWSDTRYKGLNLQHFISIAESTGRIVEIGHFVVEQSCIFLNRLDENQRKSIFVNLSVAQLSEVDLVKKVSQTLSRYNIDADLIGFELTESMVGESMGFVRNAIEAIRNAGHSVAIDDFGTGHSNLKYIHMLPVNTLKIDKSFVEDIIDPLENYPIVNTIIAMAENMGLTTVAEGVETAAQARYLFDRKVDEIQGYYFYRPLTPEQYFALYSPESLN